MLLTQNIHFLSLQHCIPDVTGIKLTLETEDDKKVLNFLEVSLNIFDNGLDIKIFG